MQAWDVYRGHKLIDTVWYSGTREEVKRSLVEHDGYPSDIKVVKVRM